MKNKFIFTITVSLFLITFRGFSQTGEYPTHLFLGEFIMATEKDKTIETWEQGPESVLTGKTVYEYEGGSLLSETLRILFVNGKLNYCATVLEQDSEKPQGEICFGLKSFSGNIFTFENLNHDFPKRIIYDFDNYRNVNVRVEGDTSGFDLKYERKTDEYKSYTVNGKFIKEPFENKAGKIIGGVFDYFFEIQSVRYFVKLKDNTINKTDVENALGKEVKVSVIFGEGLWDSDDPSHQSRVGKYIKVIKIL